MDCRRFFMAFWQPADHIRKPRSVEKNSLVAGYNGDL